MNKQSILVDLGSKKQTEEFDKLAKQHNVEKF